jgi:hypothetical protein
VARVRTRAIRDHRSQIEERNRAKEAELARRQRETERIREASRAARERIALSKQSNERSIESLKRHEARKLVEEHAKNLEQIQVQREQALLRAREMKAMIQTQHEEGRRSREAMLEQRRQRAEDTFRQKLLEEAGRSQDHESRVVSMEQKERELIELLAQAQEEQRRAYAELESALLASHSRTHGGGGVGGGVQSARNTQQLQHAPTLAYGQAPEAAAAAGEDGEQPQSTNSADAYAYGAVQPGNAAAAAAQP